MARRNRRKRRKWHYGRVAALLVILVAIIGGGVMLIRGGSTNFSSVGDGAGTYIVKANSKILSKGTGEAMKKNLYVPRKIDTSKPLIAFTFDDGPKPGNTERIIKVLDQYNYRATFFMLGQNAKEYPSVVKKVYESGNEVGGHSYDHPILPNLSASGISSQYDRMNDAIYAACGNRVTVFRPPYGAINDKVRKAIDKPLILWSVDTLDWKTRNRDATVKSILKHAVDGSIVLMHDIHEPSVEAVEKVVPMLKKKGYEVCTVSELLEAKGIKAAQGDTVISANQITHSK